MKYKSIYPLQVFDCIPSTNIYAKEQREKGKNLVVIAKSQTGGMGTKGRDFSSAEGGMYLTKLQFYKDFPTERAFEIMAKTAVTVCETLLRFGVQPSIKWPNDIFVQDKKICGILIENTFSGKHISSSIVGVGLNINNPLPESLLAIATTMQKVTGKTLDVVEVTNAFLEEWEKPFDMGRYHFFVGYMGRTVELLVNGKEEKVTATLVCVDDRGNLHVEIDGKAQVFSSVEISIKL